MSLRMVVLLALAASVLGACSDSDAAQSATAPETSTTVADELTGDPSMLDSITVSSETGVPPTVEFDTPFSTTASARKVLRDGDGAVLEEGMTAVFDFVMVNGRDGSVYASSYADPTDPEAVVEPAVFTMDDALMLGVRLGMTGMKEGSRVLVAIAPNDGFGPSGGDPDYGLEADDTLLLVADLHEVRTPLDRATGTPVVPAEDLPLVEVADDGAPTISVPEGNPPGELVSQVLIDGDGAPVQSGQTITVHYTGVLWDSGEVFDSSWETGAPATFQIGTGSVIPGWDKSLVGATVGSQLLLVVPPADGYPDGSGTIPADSTLVFVVDILDAYGS